MRLNITHRRILARAQLRAAHADWRDAAVVPVLLSRVTRMSMAGATILLVGSAHRDRTTAGGASAEAKAVHRQRKYSS